MSDAIEQFFVASRKPGEGHAVLVADEDEESVRRFYTQHAGASIVKVGRVQMSPSRTCT